MVSQREFAVYTLPEKGGQAALVVHGGRPSQPRWTSDGKHIVFMKMARENPSQLLLDESYHLWAPAGDEGLTYLLNTIILSLDPKKTS